MCNKKKVPQKEFCYAAICFAGKGEVGDERRGYKGVLLSILERLTLVR